MRVAEDARTLLLGLLLLTTCLYALLARDTYGADFRAYYVAAEAAHAGLDPYFNQVNVDERFADAAWLENHSRFVYPPSSLLLFAPLARLPYRVAKVVWGTAMALAMVWILMALRDRYPGCEWLALGLFLSLPMAANVDNGQVDVLVLGLTLACLWARWRWLGGLCLGVAIAIKFSPVLIVLWLLARRRWVTAAWAVGSAALLMAAAARLWGGGLLREFLAHLRVHLAPGAPLLQHTYTGFRVLYGRFVVMGTNTYALHYFYGTRQNPLRALGAAGGFAGLAIVLLYLVWLLASRRGRALTAQAGFFGFLAVALFANPLLWPAGLVACFPLTISLVARVRRPAAWSLALLAPFYLPIEGVWCGRFLMWLAIAGLALLQVQRDGLTAPAEYEAVS